MRISRSETLGIYRGKCTLATTFPYTERLEKLSDRHRFGQKGIS